MIRSQRLFSKFNPLGNPMLTKDYLFITVPYFLFFRIGLIKQEALCSP